MTTNNMYFEKICKRFIPTKNACDKARLYYPSRDDFLISTYTCDVLPKFETPFQKNKLTTKNHIINESLKQFEIFGEDIYTELFNIVNKVKLARKNDNHIHSVYISFKKKNDKIINPGYVEYYQIPRILYDIDTIFLGHEHCHALKESNYEERKYGLILSEVIPIFYELIDYENDILRQKVLERRIHALNQDKNIYLVASSAVDSNFIYRYNNAITEKPTNIQKEMYLFMKAYTGVYLSNFYYATVLYNMYKQDPLTILKLVSDVLKHKLTTYEMLNHLNLYCNTSGSLYEKEINNMKRVLTK